MEVVSVCVDQIQLLVIINKNKDKCRCECLVDKNVIIILFGILPIASESIRKKQLIY